MFFRRYFCIIICLTICLAGKFYAGPQEPELGNSSAQVDPLYSAKVLQSTYNQYRSTHSGELSLPQGSASSGYEALYCGLIMQSVPKAHGEQKTALFEKLQDRSACTARVADWRSHVIKNRLEEFFINYLYLKYLHLFQLQVGIMQKALDGDSLVEIMYVSDLLPGATDRVVKAHGYEAGTFTLTPQEFYTALEQEAQAKAPRNAFDESICMKYFSELKPISGELRCSNNQHEIYEDKKQVLKETYGPSEDTSDSPDGSWLTALDLKDLAEHKLKNSPEGTHPKDIHFLEFSETLTPDEHQMNNAELTWLRTQLVKNPHEFQALFLIRFDQEWISCVITKFRQVITFMVTDPQNKDRHTEKGLVVLAQTIQDALTPRKAPPIKNENPLRNLGRVQQEEKPAANKVNYDPPLAHLKDHEIPSLNDFFGEKIPNAVTICIKKMKRQAAPPRPSGIALKNCLLLYGPPGTGKSTIAQLMARAAGRNIVYAGGGDFRDSYQGSGKAKLDAIFAEAKRLGNCVVLIDEIDGTSSRIKSHGSTQEDNRALKSFITSLDQYRYDPDIFVICTTNYIENMDPAVTRRFIPIEVPLPDYAKRKNIINYYLKQNATEIISRTPHALSPDFYDKLISATEGFSGDEIGEMINNAIYEFQEGLKPENPHPNIDFRTQGIDLFNKSIISNLGEFARLPLIPLFMVMGESDLDKHVYSAYMRQVKLRNDLKKNERKNDPSDKYAKEPFGTRLVNRNYDYATNLVQESFWQILVRGGWKALFNSMGINV